MKSERPIHVAILGASGYGAGELLRLFTQHPAAEVVTITSTSQVGAPIHTVHPHLRGFHNKLIVSEQINFDRLFDAEQAVIISALPHGKSAATLDALLHEAEKHRKGNQLRAIDLSGDLRLQDEQTHATFYPESPLLPDRRIAFVYGLPELDRDKITGARYVANPGCLAGAAILTLAPLANHLAGPVAIDAKTGSSGSGRQLKETTHHPTRHANFRAYKPLAHQHEPEILQALGDPLGERIAASFVTQSLDASRGIYITAHLTLTEPINAAALQKRYADFYTDSPFVRILDYPPELQSVVGSNFCDIGLAIRGRQVVAMAALDNLIKGMAGTAIQNLNLMCGLPETTGLWAPALRPL